MHLLNANFELQQVPLSQQRLGEGYWDGRELTHFSKLYRFVRGQIPLPEEWAWLELSVDIIQPTLFVSAAKRDFSKVSRKDVLVH